MKLFPAREVYRAAIDLHGSRDKIQDRAAQRADSAQKRHNTIANKNTNRPVM